MSTPKDLSEVILAILNALTLLERDLQSLRVSDKAINHISEARLNIEKAVEEIVK